MSKEWRLQSTTNRQGSGDGELRWPEGYRVEPARDDEGFLIVLDSKGRPATMLADGEYTPAQYLSAREEEIQCRCRDAYEERLRFGIAREQARKDLPLSTYTEAYWKIDGHNLLHFLELRMDLHAQVELWTYADSIARLIQPIIPLTWEAFQDYRLGAILLSLPEIGEIRRLFHPEQSTQQKELSSRERGELNVKLDSLGILDRQNVSAMWVKAAKYTADLHVIPDLLIFWFR